MIISDQLRSFREREELLSEHQYEFWSRHPDGDRLALVSLLLGFTR